METVYLEQNKYKGFKLYAYVSQLLLVILTMTVIGYLLGRYLIIKTTIAAGIFALIGAVFGILYFIWGLIRIEKSKSQSER